MTPKLTSAEYVDQYRIRISFADGAAGILDLKDELWGAVFEPLRDPQAFRAFRLNRELNTTEWPATGADLAPEFLYAQVTQTQSAA